MRLVIFISLILSVLVNCVSLSLGKDYNELGLYLDPNDLSTTSIEISSARILEIYLLLTNPFLEESEFGFEQTDVTFVSGFECRVEIPPEFTLYGFVNDEVSFTNFATIPDFLVGFRYPLPVVNQLVVLGRIFLGATAQQGSYFYLRPLPEDEASIPGQMAFAALMSPTIEELQPMYPASGDFENPVFAVNGLVVPAGSETWGGVKALYR